MRMMNAPSAYTGRGGGGGAGHTAMLRAGRGGAGLISRGGGGHSPAGGSFVLPHHLGGGGGGSILALQGGGGGRGLHASTHRGACTPGSGRVKDDLHPRGVVATPARALGRRATPAGVLVLQEQPGLPRGGQHHVPHCIWG